MAAVIFVVLVVLSIAIEAQQENKTVGSSNVDSIDIQNNATNENNNESKLVYVLRSVVHQPDENNKGNNSSVESNDANNGSKTLNIDDLNPIKEKNVEENTSNTGRSGSESHETNVSSKEKGKYGSDNNTKQKIMDILTKMLNENNSESTDEEGNAYRRLDIEDNGDVFPDLIDIDNPISKDYNQDEVTSFKTTRDSTGYGARLNMKGRSGEDTLSAMNVNNLLQYRLANTRRGLFINPGFFTYPTPPSITFSKIDNRDLLPMGRLNTLNTLNSLPFRRLNIGKPVANEEAIRRVAPEASSVKVVLDTNAYPFDPEDMQDSQNEPILNYRRRVI